jgi:AcrR family transcriptional regulator
VNQVQRARMLSAAARVVAELGYGGMSVARVAASAGVSRRTFYEVFEDRDDCFLALFDDALARAGGIVHEAVVEADAISGPLEWRERVRAGLTALLRFVDEEPALGSLLVVEALGGGPRVLEGRAHAIDALIEIVHEGPRAAASAGKRRQDEGPPRLTAEGVVGAVLSVVHARLLDSHATGRAPASLVGLLNPLMGMIVLPYLGPTAARRELRRPVPKLADASHASSRTRPDPSGDPLRGIEMRLTYRTLRVLCAIAAEPGASNRRVASAAEVQDQGQISKLLTRLERFGLIHNSGEGQLKGEPNAWALTVRGMEVEQALRP